MAEKATRPSRLRYDPQVFERKWQKVWEKSKIFSPDLAHAKRPYYNLMMFPYPSAEGLHVGNMYAFTGADIWGRFTRMKGFDVFEPIGLDGFGIHSENYAIKVGEHPAELAKKTEKRFYEQLHATGNAYDWGRTLKTYDRDYYRWTQWIFVQMYKAGLAYRKKSPVNWCPSCKTVLADEQVINGACERCKSVAEKRDLEQWFFKITAYADRLLSGLTQIKWTEKVKIAQRNWIGRSEGAVIQFQNKDPYVWDETIEVFTTRPDTLHGATFLVLAPEHPLLSLIMQRKLPTNHRGWKDVLDYVQEAKGKSEADRQREGREKTGVYTNLAVTNPATDDQIPIWVADYVLGGYGSGAIMAVPAHDQRDFEFAQKYNLPIKPVIKPREGKWSGKIAYEGEGVIINSGEWNGWEWPADKEKILSYIEKKGWGRRQTSYHLRDWLISRQRYWGPPIPMIYCEKCASAGKGERKDMPGWYTVPEKDLPVKLPYVENYRPTGTGESPLAQDPSFVRVACPKCGGAARRETDVSDTFLDSAWYFLRYPSIEIKNKPFDLERTKNWLPVDMYIGGAEHSVLHLFYTRFITKVFSDWGLISFDEPFKRFYAHGLLIKDGAKMSKSKGNVVIPDEYIKKFGVDTLRTYLMFLGPFDQGGDFRDTGIEGMYRFLKRVWGLVANTRDLVLVKENESREVYQKMHQAIKRVTEDIEELKFNTAISNLMIYVNALQEIVRKNVNQNVNQKVMKSLHRTNVRCAEWDEALRALLLLLAPFAPHMTEELWQYLRVSQVARVPQVPRGEKARDTLDTFDTRGTFGSVHLQPWPAYDSELAQEDVVEIPVQVNGRLRGTLSVDRNDAGKKEVIEKMALELGSVTKYLEGEKPKRVVFIPSRLINFVV